MIDNIIDEVRLFQILFDSVDFYNKDVKNTLLKYIDKYIKYKDSNAEELKSHYEHFLKQYSKDIKEYTNSDIYPALGDGKKYEITREEYDVSLLLSTILSQHRYDIMTSIYDILTPLDSALVIGSGVGIELEIINKSYKNISAYDIEIDEFCNTIHSNVSFYEEEFVGDNSKKYNDIYIIELLEHLNNPYELLKNTKKSLKKNGRVIITLAVNMPQFDHVINFDNLDLFKKEIDNLDFLISFEKNIPHEYLVNKLTNSSNIFMILQRKQN